MSRIGRKVIQVPAAVKIAINGQTVSVTGPKGTLAVTIHPDVKVAWNDSEKSIRCSVDPSRTEIVMLRPPGGGTAIELSSFIRPDHGPGSPTAMANELGLRSVAFEVDDLQAAVDRLAADGYGLVGGIGQFENTWLMAYVRGPDGIIVALAERLG